MKLWNRGNNKYPHLTILVLTIVIQLTSLVHVLIRGIIFSIVSMNTLLSRKRTKVVVFNDVTKVTNGVKLRDVVVPN